MADEENPIDKPAPTRRKASRVRLGEADTGSLEHQVIEAAVAKARASSSAVSSTTADAVEVIKNRIEALSQKIRDPKRVFRQADLTELQTLKRAIEGALSGDILKQMAPDQQIDVGTALADSMDQVDRLINKGKIELGLDEVSQVTDEGIWMSDSWKEAAGDRRASKVGEATRIESTLEYIRENQTGMERHTNLDNLYHKGLELRPDLVARKEALDAKFALLPGGPERAAVFEELQSLREEAMQAADSPYGRVSVATSGGSSASSTKGSMKVPGGPPSNFGGGTPPLEIDGGGDGTKMNIRRVGTPKQPDANEFIEILDEGGNVLERKFPEDLLGHPIKSGGKGAPGVQWEGGYSGGGQRDVVGGRITDPKRLLPQYSGPANYSARDIVDDPVTGRRYVKTGDGFRDLGVTPASPGNAPQRSIITPTPRITDPRRLLPDSASIGTPAPADIIDDPISGNRYSRDTLNPDTWTRSGVSPKAPPRVGGDYGAERVGPITDPRRLLPAGAGAIPAAAPVASAAEKVVDKGLWSKFKGVGKSKVGRLAGKALPVVGEALAAYEIASFVNEQTAGLYDEQRAEQADLGINVSQALETSKVEGQEFMIERMLNRADAQSRVVRNVVGLSDTTNAIMLDQIIEGRERSLAATSYREAPSAGELLAAMSRF